MEWGLRISKFVYYRGSMKDLIFKVGSQKKRIYRRDCLKQEGLDSLEILEGLGKKGGGVFEEGWYPNVRYGKLNHRLTGFFLGVKLLKVVIICKRFMEVSQET